MKTLILGAIAVLVVANFSAVAYPPETEEAQLKSADTVAWCDVVSVELLEKPRIELGMSSQLRKFTLQVAEIVKGAMPGKSRFSLQYAEYEVLHTNDLKHINQPEILAWEIHGRPRIEVGKQYLVYLRKTGAGVEPLNGRWSILRSRVDPKLHEKWTGKTNQMPATVDPRR